MKLLNKTKLYFLGACLLMFSLGGIFFLILFRVIIDRDIHEKLEERRGYAIKQLMQSDSLMMYQKFSVNAVSVQRVNKVRFNGDIVSDTVILDQVERKLMSYRQLEFYTTIRGNHYYIHIRRALVEQRDLIKGVILLEIALLLTFLALLNFINAQLSKTIWRPFYRILDVISNYQIDRAENVVLERNTITEFNELGAAIEKMSGKIHREFHIQKEYTENASHEIQTPLAIIKNKMEVLLQFPDLTEEHVTIIKSMYAAASRLSKLNEALLILARIENRQFHEVVRINLIEHIDRRLSSLEELIQMKAIAVRKNYAEEIVIRMNPFLADILIENLIVNAVKHNQPQGIIQIVIRKNLLSIMNSGEPIEIAPEKLFERFAKSNTRSNSLGLGLSIVKAICETYEIPIQYSYHQKMHTISLDLRFAAS